MEEIFPTIKTVC